MTPSYHKANKQLTGMEIHKWGIAREVKKATGFCLTNIPFREFRLRGFISFEYWDINPNTPELHFHQTSPHYNETYIDITLNDMQYI